MRSRSVSGENLGSRGHMISNSEKGVGLVWAPGWQAKHGAMLVGLLVPTEQKAMQSSTEVRLPLAPTRCHVGSPRRQRPDSKQPNSLDAAASAQAPAAC